MGEGGFMSLASDATDILEPYIGRMVADTCVRATALSLGKSSDSLGPGDLPQLSANIRRLLSPIAPSATVEGIVAEIEKRAAA
ncbi:MAG TPA: hypothetical protein VGK50_04495 [Coriobacteriia bacterium]